VILGDPQTPTQQGKSSRVTLDDMFRRAVARKPESLALVDAPNRESFTQGAPRHLTYAQADRMVSAIAGRLRGLGLPVDTIVGIQLPNSVESILTLLGVLRAGMIAAPMPMLWRRAEAVAALTRIDAKVLITCGRVGTFDYSNHAMHVAAETFPIRYVCAFGSDLPDGVVPLDDLYTTDKLEPVPPMDREHSSNPAAHTAVITWDVTPDGLVPVARNHNELLAGGLAVVLESRFEQDTIILCATPATSFAGISLAVLPWLLVGGTLCLHQPFDAHVLAAQLRSHACRVVVLPGPLVGRLTEAGHLGTRHGLKTVIALWRTPERLATAAPWCEPAPNLVDVQVFGEIALFAASRVALGRPAPIPIGRLTAPRGVSGAVFVVELARTAAGTLAMRGPMVPKHAFPPNADRGTLPFFKVIPNGFVDTGYACRVDKAAETLVVTGPPAGIVSVGGYRFAQRDLEDLVSQASVSASIAALPDAFAGQRLAGAAPDRAAVQNALSQMGVNPLIVDAFRDRRAATATNPATNPAVSAVA
jgi:non-ribosomal peptide synthetase component E (peptide arylation enzyme)